MSKSKDSIYNAIKNYLIRTNRPFSANDIFNNLHNEFGKTAVNKALEELSAKQLIKEKVNGKQKIYFADQNNFNDISDQKIKEMDQQLAQLNQQFDHLREELKKKESRLSSFKSSLSLEQIEQQLEEVKNETKDLNNKLNLINSKAKDLDPKQNEKVKNERQKLVNEWKKRKRMATSMIDMILEGYPKPKKVLVEDIGIETDEDLKVSLPQI
jgi:26S proteasome regulatory subunit (ATPase 3-interacting protein)